jgi:hypothetical protein
VSLVVYEKARHQLLRVSFLFQRTSKIYIKDVGPGDVRIKSIDFETYSDSEEHTPCPPERRCDE